MGEDSYQEPADAETGVTVIPPEPIDWGSIAPVAASPSAAWGGAAQYQEQYSKPGNCAAYRSAFDASWTEAQASHNKVYQMHDIIHGREKELAPILRIAGDARVGAEGVHANATDAFSGDKLASSTSKVDSDKVSDQTRTNILRIKGDIQQAKIDVNSKSGGIADAADGLVKAGAALSTARNNLKITKTEEELEKLHVSKEQVENALKGYEADINAAVQTVKAGTDIVKCFTPSLKPGEKFEQIADAVGGVAEAAGAIGEAALVNRANSKLADIEAKANKLKATKGTLVHTNAQNAVASALADVRIAVRAITKAMGEYSKAVIALKQKYADLATEMKKAGTASGMKPKDAALLAAAVEAIPKIEEIIEFCAGLKDSVPAPSYSRASGIGAAMASNYGQFASHVGIIKGTGQYIGQIETTWHGRLASVEAAVDGATSMKSDW